MAVGPSVELTTSVHGISWPKTYAGRSSGRMLGHVCLVLRQSANCFSFGVRRDDVDGAAPVADRAMRYACTGAEQMCFDIMAKSRNR